MIHVIATIEITEGKRAEFLPHFAWVTPLVLAEEGCLEYGAAVDVASGLAVQGPVRPDTVIVVEKWASLEALKVHLKAEHMTVYRLRTRDLVRNVNLQVLEPA